MKNQISNATNTKAEFLDIKTAKNPMYQPLGGNIAVSREKVKNFTGGKKENAVSICRTTDPTPGLPNLSSHEDTQALELQAKKEKYALNLECTLKLVEELHRLMVQRGRLVYTIANLDKFEIEQKEEAEDTSTNYYQGCELEITDDKRSKFATKNPVIIRAVALFVRNLCTNRLAEIEAEITIPV